MPEITRSVGNGGSNEVHDVAMTQLLLGLVKNRSAKTYFSEPYTNNFSGATVDAIKAFQRDGKLRSPSEGEGLITPTGETWKQLVEAAVSAAPRYSKVRAWRRVPFAYLAMDRSGVAKAKVAAGKDKLQVAFLNAITTLMQKCYDESEIVWSIYGDKGGWRAFAAQEGTVSDAGYGESIHAYGYAVDLSAYPFSWILPNRQIQPVPSNMEGVDGKWVKQLFLARNAVGEEAKLNLHRTLKAGDYFHLQSVDDKELDSVGSLVALMERVGPSKMKWRLENMTPTDYHCDLGLGGDTYFVGTAVSIWTETQVKNARISPENLAAALNAKRKTDPNFSVNKFLRRPATKQLPVTLTKTEITDEDIRVVQRLLKAEFQAAADNWQKWEAVTYRSDTRRKPRPAAARR